MISLEKSKFFLPFSKDFSMFFDGLRFWMVFSMAFLGFWWCSKAFSRGFPWFF